MSEEKIVKKHNEILNHLLDYKKKNKDFVFATRVSNRGDKINKGYWFQGNENYIFVPLYKVGDDNNMTKTIGFVYTENSQYIEIVFKNIKDFNENEKDMYLSLIENLKQLEIFNVIEKEERKIYFEFKNDLEENLMYFITNFKAISDKAIDDFGLNGKYFISEQEFQKNIQKLNLNNYANENQLKQNNDKEKSVMKNKQPINQILYGPPGTGKTYNTINKALEIILEQQMDDEIKLLLKKPNHTEDERKKLKDKFEEYKKAGQIEFVTFHQSYGYEEFVEGIKADLGSGDIKYKLERGIFQKLSNIAKENFEKSSILTEIEIEIEQKFNAKLEKFKEEIEEKIDTGEKYLINDTAFIVQIEDDAFRYTQQNSKSRF